MNHLTNKYVVVSGFFASGSSAIIDLLKEVDGYEECGAEIRFIKDPHGLIDLEHSLLVRKELINSSNSLWEFYDASKKWARFGKNPLSPAGLSYKKLINKRYVKITKEYVRSLTQFTYRADFYNDGFKKPYFKYVLDRNRRYVERKTRGKIRIANRHTKCNFFSNIDDNSFYELTKKYINDLFSPFFNKGVDTLLLDQAILPIETNYLCHFFDNAKMIIVERDPRDIFVDNIISTDFMPDFPDSVEWAKDFVEIFKFIRNKNIYDDKMCLVVRFEDIVLHYQEEKQRIFDFLGIDCSKHINRLKYFNPANSKKNIGIWKKYEGKYKNAFSIIQSELKKYLYE